MLFALSKLLWAVLNPGNLLLLCALAGTLARLSRRARVRNLGRGLLALSLGAMVAIAVLPLGEWLLAPLEERFPRPAEPLGRVDGVIVLGGAVDLRVSVGRGRPELRCRPPDRLRRPGPALPAGAAGFHRRLRRAFRHRAQRGGGGRKPGRGTGTYTKGP